MSKLLNYYGGESLSTFGETGLRRQGWLLKFDVFLESTACVGVLEDVVPRTLNPESAILAPKF